MMGSPDPSIQLEGVQQLRKLLSIGELFDVSGFEAMCGVRSSVHGTYVCVCVEGGGLDCVDGAKQPCW
jgi:hypothetical protein